jgi:hypothetical protein
MDLLFLKSPTGLTPACEEASEWLAKKKLGATVLVNPREPRNGSYFRKWWALVKVGFDYWSECVQPMEYKGRPVLANFERFRKDVTILAGFYDPVVNVRGETRLEAKSLQWSRMDEHTFGQLYDATIQVLLQQVFNGARVREWSEAELRAVVDEVMAFAA